MKIAIIAVVLIPRKARCSRRSNIPPLARRPFGRGGAVATRQPTQSRYIHRATKTNVAIGQEHLAIRLYDAVPGAQGRPEATDALAGWEYTLEFDNSQ